MQLMEGERRGVNSELWHACAGPRISLPSVGSLVVYFPQGHSEQVAASTLKEVDGHIPNYPNLESQLVCQLHNVALHADLETDEVFAQMTLQPLNEQEKDLFLPPDIGMQNRQPTDFFCKILTASDTSTHGGFSVPRRAAEKVFPPLDFTMQPPAQELRAKDLHDTEWIFRHIYRGQPKRHLLTTGWSVFVSAKRLVAGDSVLFIRDDKGQMLLGIRRANSKQQSVLPSSVLSSDSMHIGVLAAAAHAAATSSRFQVFYNPRTSPSEFVIPLSKYRKAFHFIQMSVGMRFRMVFETEESTLRRYMGTITGIADLDPTRWPGSKWRNLEVGWDESSAGERPSRVSLWEVEPVATPFIIYPPFALGPKRPVHPGLFGDEEGSVKRYLTLLQGESGNRNLSGPMYQSLGGDMLWGQFQERVEPVKFDTYDAVAAAALQNLRATGALKAPQLSMPQQGQFRMLQQMLPHMQQPSHQQEPLQSDALWPPHAIFHQQQGFQNHQQMSPLLPPPLPPSQPPSQLIQYSQPLLQNPQPLVQHSPPLQLPRTSLTSLQPSSLVLSALQSPLSHQHLYPTQLQQQQQWQHQHQWQPQSRAHSTPEGQPEQPFLQSQPALAQTHQSLLQTQPTFQMQQSIPPTQQQNAQTLGIPTHMLQVGYSHSQPLPTIAMIRPGMAFSESESSFGGSMIKPGIGFSESDSGFCGSMTMSASSFSSQGVLEDFPKGVSSLEDTAQLSKLLQANQGMVQVQQMQQNIVQQQHTALRQQQQPPRIVQQPQARSEPKEQHAAQDSLALMTKLPTRETQVTGSWFPFSSEITHCDSQLLSTNQVGQSDTSSSTVTSCSYSLPIESSDDSFYLPTASGSFQARFSNMNKEVPCRALNDTTTIGSFSSPNESFTSGTPDCGSIGAGIMTNAVLDEAILSQSWPQVPAPLRTYTKVHKSGSAGRLIDLSRLTSYKDLRRELAQMFKIEGQLEDPQRSFWQLVFVDNDGDILLVGDDPWDEFVSCVRAIKILSTAQVLQLNQEGLEQLNGLPMQQHVQTSGSSEDCQLWRDV